ncbi:MAG TPA: hypothetical protein DCE56_17825 [Cyanobacteria bacterium UBA8553]|nr:hypothetical protein [Cyanobacteria bacterium UBA8553]HAJ62289.1 hypothetical protein [Cyanobacteria bacterium UBA8543]
MQLFQRNRRWIAIICSSVMGSLLFAPLAIAATPIDSEHDKSQPINELFEQGNLLPSVASSHSNSSVFDGFPLMQKLNEINSWLNLSTAVLMPGELPPDATIVPVNGAVKVQLTNPTSTAISFEVLGHTEPRILSARSSTTLKSLPTPVSVMFRRQDGGLLSVQPHVSETPGVLQIVFEETSDLGADRIAMKVDSDGAVFLN